MNDFSPVLVQDSRLSLVSKARFESYQGAAAISPTTIPSNSTSSNSLTYSVQVPSQENVVDTCFLVKSTIQLTITGTPVAGAYLFTVDGNLASDSCLNAFPFHQLIQTAQATINQTQVTCQTNDILPQLLYMIGRKELSEYNNMCPTQLDNVNDYSQNGYLNSNQSVFNGWLNGFDYNNVPRGSWVFDSITGNAIGDGATPQTAVVTFTTTEPLFLSPLIWKEQAGIQGVQSINVQFNLDSEAKKCLKVAGALPVGYKVAMKPLNSEIQVVFLSAKPSQLSRWSPRNVLPYYKLDRYISNSVNIATGATKTITSPSIQLSSIPRSVIAVVRNKTGNTTWNTPDWFLPIKKVTINWNTRSGLLSSCSPEVLYKYSTEAGVQQSYLEWSGLAMGGLTVPTTRKTTHTIGSVLALEFARHIEIQEEYLSRSSIGQYSFQINIDALNTFGADVDVEVCLIFDNEGIFTTERGQSNTYVNLLSKEMVMQTLGDKPEYDVKTEGVPNSANESLEGGKKYRMNGSAASGGGRSGGKSRLHSRLM